MGLILGSGTSPGEGNGNPFWYSCLENTMDRGAWRAIVYGVKNELERTQQLNNNSIKQNGFITLKIPSATSGYFCPFFEPVATTDLFTASLVLPFLKVIQLESYSYIQFHIYNIIYMKRLYSYTAFSYCLLSSPLVAQTVKKLPAMQETQI